MPRFDKLEKAEHQKVSAAGGRKRHPKKGFGSLSKRERSIVSSRAARARWDKVTKEKEVQNGQSVNPTED